MELVNPKARFSQKRTEKKEIPMKLNRVFSKRKEKKVL